MPHNFAILQPGALEEVGMLAEATARDADAMARHYIPKSDKILLASRLLQTGQNQALSFVAPTEPGIYPYVCTYPGHWRRMYGALYVVDNLPDYRADPAAYLAANALLVRGRTAAIQHSPSRMENRRPDLRSQAIADGAGPSRWARSCSKSPPVWRAID